MNTYVSTAIVRQRGQLTIPDELREKFEWLTSGSVVTVISDMPNVIKITPYQDMHKSVDWKSLRLQIGRVRSYKGLRGNLSKFIVRDRESH